MISEEDKELKEEAKTCDNCLCWLKHCKAECCSTVYVSVPSSELLKKGKYVIVHQVVTLDDKWYFKLHGVLVQHSLLKFDKTFCHPYNGRILYVRRCKMLREDNKCALHYIGKPKLCSGLTEQTSKIPNKKLVVTPNCLFRYKNMLEEKNGKESKNE